MSPNNYQKNQIFIDFIEKYRFFNQYVAKISHFICLIIQYLD